VALASFVTPVNVHFLREWQFVPSAAVFATTRSITVSRRMEMVDSYIAPCLEIHPPLFVLNWTCRHL
jgi:hypothetical protein